MPAPATRIDAVFITLLLEGLDWRKPPAVRFRCAGIGGWIDSAAAATRDRQQAERRERERPGRGDDLRAVQRNVAEVVRDSEGEPAGVAEAERAALAGGAALDAEDGGRAHA